MNPLGFAYLGQLDHTGWVSGSPALSIRETDSLPTQELNALPIPKTFPWVQSLPGNTLNKTSKSTGELQMCYLQEEGEPAVVRGAFAGGAVLPGRWGLPGGRGKAPESNLIRSKRLLRPGRGLIAHSQAAGKRKCRTLVQCVSVFSILLFWLRLCPACKGNSLRNAALGG